MVDVIISAAWPTQPFALGSCMDDGVFFACQLSIQGMDGLLPFARKHARQHHVAI